MACEHAEARRPHRRVSVADIASQPGGIEALRRRVHELRSSGEDFAANAIEREMAEFDLSAE